MTYVAQNLIGTASTDNIILVRVACPLVQVGTVLHIAEDVLTFFGHNMADHVRRDMKLSLGFMVVLLVVSLHKGKTSVLGDSTACGSHSSVILNNTYISI